MEASNSRSLAVDDQASSAPALSQSTSSSPKLTLKADSPTLPLDTLEYGLGKVRVAIIRLQKDLEAANQIVDPSFFSGLFSAKPNPQVKEDLTQLMAQINPTKNLDKQLNVFITAYKSLSAYLEVLVKEVKRKKTENKQAIISAVEESYEKLFQQFLDDCNRYHAILCEKQKLFQDYSANVTQVRKECDWLDADSQVIIGDINTAARFIEELKQLATRFAPIKTDLPEGTRQVPVDIDGAPEKRSNFDEVKNEYESYFTQYGFIEKINLQDLSGIIARLHEQLNVIKTLYMEADQRYSSLLRMYDGDFVTHRENLVSEINSLITKEQLDITQNQESILKILSVYLNDDEILENQARAELEKLFSQRNGVAETLKRKLETLEFKANSLDVKINEFSSEVRKLDDQYNGLRLTSLDETVVYLFASAQDEQSCALRLKKDLFLEDLEKVKKEIDKQEASLEAISALTPPLQKRIDTAIVTEKQIMTARLQMLTTGIWQLEESEGALKRIYDALDENIGKIEKLYKEAKAKYNEIIGFLEKIDKSKSNWHLYQAPQIEVAVRKLTELSVELRKVQNYDSETEEELKKTRRKWEEFAGSKEMFDGWFKALPEFPERSIFYRALKTVSDAEREIFVDPTGIEIKPENELFNKLLKSYKSFVRRTNQLKDYFPTIVPEADKVPQALFDTVKKQVEKLLRREEVFTAQVEQNRKKFEEYFAKIGWKPKEEMSAADKAQLVAYPSLLEKALFELKGHANALFGIEENIDKEIEKLQLAYQLQANNETIKDFRNKFSAYTSVLKSLKKNLNDYLIKFKRYKEKEQGLSLAAAKISQIAGALTVRSVHLATLRRDHATCETIAETVQTTSVKINKNRQEIYALLKRLSIKAEVQKIQGKLAAIEKEVAFKQQVFILLGNIAKLKNRISTITCERGELFERLRNQFLYAGKSKSIITKLLEHKRVRHGDTPKGVVIDDFIHGLFNQNFADLEALQTYLEHPFPAEAKNEQLFASSKFNFGQVSTTQAIINELREELMLLVAKERCGLRGSITYAIRNDCQEIKRDYNNVLSNKDITRAIGSQKLSEDCDALIARAFRLPEHDVTAKKLREDMMELQRWANLSSDGPSLELRIARMRCAFALRQNDPNAQKLFDEHKFSYSYQALKYHLENVETNRKGDLATLWRSLDQIAFGPENEDAKYQKLRSCVLQFFNFVRKDNSNSFTGFFGRVSRLTKATEAFLLRDENNRGLGFKQGEGKDEVQHAKEGGVFALACCMRPN